jgi:hypothetical protein
MRRIHLAVGILALAAFAASGQVMLRHVPPMHLLGDDVRLMYRSRHIYLLGSGIANVLLGLYSSAAQGVVAARNSVCGIVTVIGGSIVVGTGVRDGNGAWAGSDVAECSRVAGDGRRDVATFYCGGAA